MYIKYEGACYDYVYWYCEDTHTYTLVSTDDPALYPTQ